MDERDDSKRQWRLKVRDHDLSSQKGTPFELAEDTPTRRTDRVHVHDLMRPWTRRVGFPALHVRADYVSENDSYSSLHMHFSQRPFSRSPRNMCDWRHDEESLQIPFAFASVEALLVDQKKGVGCLQTARF